MRIKILGTAAAEGWPALFCNCQACVEALKLKGKNIRTRSSIQIDEILKIDFPPDSLYHALRYQLTFADLSFLLITHAHFDHLATEQLSYLIPPFALQDQTKTLKVFGTAEVIERIKTLKNWDESLRPSLLNILKPFQSLRLDPYVIETVEAVHGTEGQSLNYLISRDQKRFLYASDTGFYKEKTWNYLRGKYVDLVIAECTGGPQNLTYGSHMGFPNIQKFRTKAESIGLTNDDTIWVITHFSHTGGMLHEDLRELTAPFGYEVAWDGMEIQL